MDMNVKYAYYLSATFIPPKQTGGLCLFWNGAHSLLGLAYRRKREDANQHLGTGRKKIIDTRAYPGLAVKGIAAVGPTLDVYGEVCTL